MFGQSFLEVARRLKFWLFRRPSSPSARTMVSSRGASISLGLIKLCDDPLVVCLDDIFGDAFHTEDFDIQRGAIAECIVDASQGFLVDLVHVNGEACQLLKTGLEEVGWSEPLTSGGVQSAPTSLTLKMLSLLM